MNWLLLRNSLLVGSLTTLLAGSLGLVVALWLAGLEKRWRFRILAVAILSLALPPFLVTNCWLDLLGYTGLWRRWVPLNIISIGGGGLGFVPFVLAHLLVFRFCGVRLLQTSAL